MSVEKSCEFKDQLYPEGGVVCIGDQCMQCRDGKWMPMSMSSRDA